MRHLTGVALVLSALPALANDGDGAGSALWESSGSTLRQIAKGAEEKFVYETPRAGIGAAGVKPGTTLFQGSRVDRTYVGTAYVFSERCGAVPYRVRGKISADDTQIDLHGDLPAALDADCRPTHYQQDQLRLRAVRSARDNAAAPRPRDQKQPDATAASKVEPAQDTANGNARLLEQQALIKRLQAENEKLKAEAEQRRSAEKPASQGSPDPPKPQEASKSPIVTGAIASSPSARSRLIGFALAVALACILAIAAQRWHRQAVATATRSWLWVRAMQPAPIAALSRSATAAMRRHPPNSTDRTDTAPPPDTRKSHDATIAMSLAHSYILDLRDGGFPTSSADVLSDQQLATLAFAERQIELARELDEHATLMVADDGETPTAYSIDQLRACVLLCDGFLHRYCDVPRSHAAIADAIKLDPENAATVHVLGPIQAESQTAGKWYPADGPLGG